MRGLFYIQDGDTAKVSTRGRGKNQKKHSINKSQLRKSPTNRGSRTSPVVTDTRLSLRSNTSSNNEVGDSLMMIFGGETIHDGETSSTGNISNAIVHHRNSRIKEVCDSLICVGSPTTMAVKTTQPRSKPCKHVTHSEISKEAVDELMLHSDSDDNESTSDLPTSVKDNQRSLDDFSPNPAILEGGVSPPADFGCNSTIENISDDDSIPRMSSAQQTRCSHESISSDSVEFNIEDNAARTHNYTESTIDKSRVAVKPINDFDDTSIDSDIWNMNSSTSDEDQISRNPTIASAQSVAVISIESDSNGSPTSFGDDTVSTSLDVVERSSQLNMNDDLDNEEHFNTSSPPDESDNDSVSLHPSRVNASVDLGLSDESLRSPHRDHPNDHNENAALDISSSISFFFSNVQLTSTEHNMISIQDGKCNLCVRCRYCSTLPSNPALSSFPDVISAVTHFNMKHIRYCTKAPLTITNQFIEMDEFDTWGEGLSSQSVQPLQHESINRLRSSPRHDDEVLWEKWISQIIDFKKEYKHCKIPRDSELGKWLDDIVVRLSSISSRDNIKGLIDAGVEWPFSCTNGDHDHRPPSRSTRRFVHDAVDVSTQMTPCLNDQVGELFDITTGKQDSVTSSITSTTRTDAAHDRQQNTNPHDIHLKPRRKKISLIPRIHGKREHQLRNKVPKADVRGTTKAKRPHGDRSLPDILDSDGDSYDSNCYHHNLYAAKIGLKRKREYSNPWSSLLFHVEDDGSRLHGKQTKRIKMRQLEYNSCGDVLQNLFEAPGAAVASNEVASKDQKDKDTLASALLDS